MICFIQSYVSLYCFFFDDILVYSSSINVHCEHLQFVFYTLLTNIYHAKESKCVFAADALPFLGHITSAKVVNADAKELHTIQA